MKEPVVVGFLQRKQRPALSHTHERVRARAWCRQRIAIWISTASSSQEQLCNTVKPRSIVPRCIVLPAVVVEQQFRTGLMVPQVEDAVSLSDSMESGSWCVH